MTISAGLFLVGFVLAYCVVGSVAVHLWWGRVARWRLLIALQVYMLGSYFLAGVVLLFMTPVLHSKAAPYFILGGAGALVGAGALFAVADVVAIRLSRRATRQQQASAHAHPANTG